MKDDGTCRAFVEMADSVVWDCDKPIYHRDKTHHTIRTSFNSKVPVHLEWHLESMTADQLFGRA